MVIIIIADVLIFRMLITGRITLISMAIFDISVEVSFIPTGTRVYFTQLQLLPLCSPLPQFPF